MSPPRDKKLLRQLAVDFLEAWDANEESAGEEAAFQATCEQFMVGPTEAWTILAYHPKARRIIDRAMEASA